MERKEDAKKAEDCEGWPVWYQWVLGVPDMAGLVRRACLEEMESQESGEGRQGGCKWEGSETWRSVSGDLGAANM